MFCATKIITTELCNELACGTGLPITAQHNITTVQTQGKTTVETVGKTTVTK